MDDVARIKTRIHTHQGDPGFRVARENGRLNWRCAAVSWEQGRMDVYAAVHRNVEHGGRENESKGCHDDEIGMRVSDRQTRLFGAQSFRLVKRQTQPSRLNRYGWTRHFPASARLAIWLR